MPSRCGQGLSALVVDDEPHLLMLFVELLSDLGFEVEIAESCAAARKRWQASAFDLLFCDKNLPDGNGLELVAELRTARADCEVVMISGYASVDSIIEALRTGVADFLAKPFGDLAEVELRIERAVGLLTLRREHRALKQRVAELERARR